MYGQHSNIASATAAKKLEDPRKMLDQAVSEMKEDLVKMRQASAEVMSTQRMLESKFTQAQASAVSITNQYSAAQEPAACRLVCCPPVSWILDNCKAIDSLN